MGFITLLGAKIVQQGHSQKQPQLHNMDVRLAAVNLVKTLAITATKAKDWSSGSNRLPEGLSQIIVDIFKPGLAKLLSEALTSNELQYVVALLDTYHSCVVALLSFQPSALEDVGCFRGEVGLRASFSFE